MMHGSKYYYRAEVRLHHFVSNYSVEEPLGNLSGGSFELVHKLTSCVNCVVVSYPVQPMQTFAVAHTKDSSALPLVAQLSWDSDIRLTQGL